MTKGPDLAPHGRWDHGCSTIKYPNGTNLIIGKKHDAFKKYNRFTKNSRPILSCIQLILDSFKSGLTFSNS